MADIANLVLAVDSTQVKSGTAALDGLTAAGTRAQAAAVGLGGGVKGAGAEAAAMAASAQAASRAAMGMATGFKASSEAARVNTMAMRETLVVARELSRGNFTRIPGSLTLLAQGISAQGGGLGGFAASIGKTLGLIKTLQNAELAEEATSAAASAAAVEGAAKRAAANVMAADTEIALAEAQARLTAGTSAAGAAEIRLAEARAARSAASSESVVAETALAEAYMRSDAAAAASAASTTTAMTGLGAALGVISVAAATALAGFEGFRAEVKDSGDLDRYAEGLRLTKSEIEKAGGSVTYLGHNIQEVHGLTITFGDAFHGTMSALSEAAGVSASNFRHFWTDALLQVAQVGVSEAQVIAGAFAAVASVASNLKNLGVAIINPSLAGAAGGLKSPGQIGQDALNAFKTQFAATGKFFHVTLPNSIEGAARDRLKGLADSNNPPKGPKGRHPRDKHAPEDQFDDLSARLNEEILNAKKSLAGGVIQQAQFELQAVEVEKNKTITDAQRLVKEHKLSAIEEQKVELLAGQLATLKTEKILRDVAIAKLKAQQAITDQQYQFRVDDLKFADEMATTQSAHRKIQLEMLDIETQQKAAQLKSLLAQEALANDWSNYAVHAAQLFNLPTSAAQQRDLILKKTENPLQQWMDSIPHTADAINEALQSIEVKGLDGLSSAIAGVVTGTESLKTAFSDLARSVISDIIQMTIKMLIFRALSGMFGGGGASMNGVTQLNGGTMSITPSALGNIFSRGGVVPFASGGVVSSPTMFPMSGGRTGLMGEAGPEAVMPLARDNRGRLGVRAANSNGPIEITIGFGDAPQFAPFVQAVSSAHAKEAVKISVNHTNSTLRTIAKPKLMGA